MDEVYRAKDTRLDRTVAIKVLQGHLALRGEIRHRSEREAKAISGLSHPNSCTLYVAEPGSVSGHGSVLPRRWV